LGILHAATVTLGRKAPLPDVDSDDPGRRDFKPDVHGRDPALVKAVQHRQTPCGLSRRRGANAIDRRGIRAYKGGRCLVQSIVYYRIGSCSLAIQALICGVARVLS